MTAPRDIVLLVLDSCRYDTFMAARPRNIERLGEVRRRYSYATWTSPSHFNLLMGLLPHASPRNVHASEVYRDDLGRWSERLDIEDVGFLGMLPRLWLPDYLRAEHGYLTRALVSLPVLNPATPINTGFDSYDKMERHDDLAGMLDRLEFSDGRPTFWLLNAGETHYPYRFPGQPAPLPKLSGVHGVFERLAQGRPVEATRFSRRAMAQMRRRQENAVRYVDSLVERLYDLVPERTWIIITSDHGELFGEGGYFGHGPILHDKVLEVPLVEGTIR